MLRPLFSLLVCWLLSFSSAAHPSYGLVIRPNGRLVFCDVLHDGGTIWLADPDGSLTRPYTQQHAHFLFQDQRGHIYGTHHEYLPRTEGNRNTLWRLNEQLELEVVLPPTEDPSQFSGVNFVVTAAGDIIFNFDKRLYMRRQGDSAIPWTEHRFDLINSLQLDRAGNVLVVESRAHDGAIYRISPRGELSLLAKGLKLPVPHEAPYDNPDHNRLYSAFADTDASIWVADIGHRRLIRIAADGGITYPYHSEAPWYPVAFARYQGAGYVLEHAYLPGEGHRGPRVTRLLEGRPEVLLEVGRTPYVNRTGIAPGPRATEPELPSRLGHFRGWYLVLGMLGLIGAMRVLRNRLP